MNFNTHAPLFHMSAARLSVGIIAGTLLSFLLISQAEAANRYWAGGVSDRWESAANWASVPKGAGGAGVPGAADVAILNTSGSTVRIRSQVNVGGLIMAQVWTGSLLQGTGTLTIGTSGVRVGSGRLIGGNAAIAIAGAYTQTGGIVTGIQNNFTLSGALSITKGASSPFSTFTSTGTIILDGNADQAFTVGANATKGFKHLTLQNSGGGTSDDIVMNVNGGLSLSGALTITLGNLDLTTNSVALVTEGGVTLADAAQATLTTNSNVTASGTILVNDSATITVSAGTLTLNDDGDQTVDLDGQSIFNLTLNNTGGGTNDDVILNGGGLNLSGALTVTLGNLDLTTNSQAMVAEKGITLADAAQATLATNSNVTASGTILVNDSATLAVTAGTWTLNDDGDQNVDLDGQSLYNLTLNNTGGGTNDEVILAGGQLGLSGALTVTLGYLDMDTNALALNVDGNVVLANSAQATLSGSTMNFGGGVTVNASATFTHTSGTVTLDGTNQTLSGSITFHNLTKSVTSAATLTFAATTTQTITNTLTLNGAASNLLSLRSSQTGTQWKIDPQGTRTVSYLDVKDSNNTNSTAISCTTTCTDSGNNTNWTLTVASSSSAADSGGTSGGGGGGRRGIVERTRQVLQGLSSSSATGIEASSSSSQFLSIFNDVPRDAWYAPYVTRLKSRGIISGYKDAAGRDLKKFGPANPTTYAEIAKMTLLLSGQAPADTPSLQSHWATSYIAKARSLGFSLYIPALNIDASAPRGAVVLTLLEAYEIPLQEGLPSPFSDLPADHRFARALLTAHNLGIISGDAVAEGKPRTVRPDAPINRAEVAKILFLFSEKYAAPLAVHSVANVSSAASSSSERSQSLQTVGKTYRVGTPSLNLRADAHTNAEVLRVLKAGNIVTLLNVEYGTWAYIRLPDGLQGYVWYEHLREE